MLSPRRRRSTGVGRGVRLLLFLMGLAGVVLWPHGSKGESRPSRSIAFFHFAGISYLSANFSMPVGPCGENGPVSYFGIDKQTLCSVYDLIEIAFADDNRGSTYCLFGSNWHRSCYVGDYYRLSSRK